MAHTEWFGYAANAKDGALEGLLFGSTGGVYLTDQALLVHPQVAADARPAKSTTSDRPQRTSDAAPMSVRAKKPAASFRRFHATTALDAKDPFASFTEIVQNVIEPFQADYGTQVVITVEIEARRVDGFKPETVRNVRQNTVDLKFKTADFEDD